MAPSASEVVTFALHLLVVSIVAWIFLECGPLSWELLPGIYVARNCSHVVFLHADFHKLTELRYCQTWIES